MRLCRLCGFRKELSSFEGKRRQCSECRWELRRKKFSELGDTMVRRLVKYARKRALKKGLDFDEDVAEHLIELGGCPSKCPILGIELSYSGGDSSPSLDRIDNSKGYIKGNVMIISFRANRLKSDATIYELKLISEFIKGGGNG